LFCFVCLFCLFSKLTSAGMRRSVLLADLYLTHEPINLTLTSSFNLTDDSFGAEGNRQASVRDDRTTTTIPLGSNSLFVRLRVNITEYTQPFVSHLTRLPALN